MKMKRVKAIKTLVRSYRETDCLSLEYVLPDDAESYERMVEQVAAAASKGWIQKKVYNDYDRAHVAKMTRYYRCRARTYLRAIGIVPPKKSRT